MKRIVLAALLSLTGCTAAQRQAAVPGTIDVAICILEHATMDPEMILMSCAGATVEAINAVLTAHAMAEHNEQAAALQRKP